MGVPGAWVTFSVSVCCQLCLQAATGSLPILQPSQGWHCPLIRSPRASLALSSLWKQMESGEERLLAITALLKSAFSEQDL